MPAALDVDTVSDVRVLGQGNVQTVMLSILCTTDGSGDPVAASVLGSGARGAKPTITRSVNTYTATGFPMFQRLRFAMVHSTGAKGSVPTGTGTSGSISWVAAAPILSGVVAITAMVDI